MQRLIQIKCEIKWNKINTRNHRMKGVQEQRAFFISGKKSDWFPKARGFTVDPPCSLSFIMASLRSKKWCKLKKSPETNPPDI